MSEEFESAFSEAVGEVVKVCHCKRTHFAVDRRYYDSEIELEELLAKMQKSPDKYIPHDGHIFGINVFGSFFVPDCPCGGVAKVEKLIWSQRDRIMSYIRKIIKHKEQKLQKLKNEIQGIEVE